MDKKLIVMLGADFIALANGCNECAEDVNRRPILNSIRFSRGNDKFIVCDCLQGAIHVRYNIEAIEIDNDFNELVIESDSLVNVAKILKADKFARMNPVFINTNDNNDIVIVSSVGSYTITKDHTHNGEFPNLDSCVKPILDREGYYSIKLGVDMLERIVKIAKTRKLSGVSFSFSENNEKPVKYSMNDIEGVVCPLRR